MFGISYTNNLTYNGSYGASTPIGNNGARILEYFPDLTIGGNVLAGAPSSALTIYNGLQKTFGPNLNPTVAAINADMVNRAGIATDPSGACLKAGSAFAGKGVDCSRLTSVFALMKVIPPDFLALPPALVATTKQPVGKPNPDKRKPEHDRVFLTPGSPLPKDAKDASEICVEMSEGDPLCFGTVVQTRGKSAK